MAAYVGVDPKKDIHWVILPKDTSYQWRQYDIEDTVRFWALRLHQAGMIKSTPQRIMAQGTDWRFFNELKRELKG
jgi:NitT/TauT family transport system substrate-binding protein